jgi:hypothetical protein
MTPRPDTGPLDLVTLAADDALLDALGRGEPVSGDDEVAALLAAWRADLAGASTGAVVDTAGAARRRGGRRRWWFRPVTAAAALVLVAGGVAVAVGTATPDSPLWPVAAAVDPERADVVTADHKLSEARRAIGDGRYADARRLADQAAAAIARVRDPGQVKRLTTELADVRRRLSSAGSGTHGGGARPTPTPAPPPAPGPTPSAPRPSPSPSGDGLPVPGLSVPGGILPSLPLPSLPGLP